MSPQLKSNGMVSAYISYDNVNNSQLINYRCQQYQKWPTQAYTSGLVKYIVAGSRKESRWKFAVTFQAVEPTNGSMNVS